MRDLIVLVWVGFIFFAAVFSSVAAIACLFQHKRIRFDQGFFLSLSACVLSIILCLSLWPPVHRVYDDEFTYISQSVNIRESGKANITLKGSRLQPEIFDSWAANPKLPGFACLEAVVLFFTKDFDRSYFILNIVLGALSVLAVYRITWLLTASHLVAWWAAVFWACLPVRITYAMSAASDIAGVFFCLLFFLFLAEYRALPLKRILYAALFCGIFSICIKPFYGIYVILGLAVVLYYYRRDGLLDRKLYAQILLDAFCLFLPILSAAPVFFLSDSMSGGYSFSFIFKNIGTSLLYFFDYKQMTILTALVSLVAVGGSLFYKRDKWVIISAGWLLMGILMISVFYAGGFSYPGKAYSDRYFIPLAFPFVFLAAKGAADIITRFGIRFWGVLFFVILIINALMASKYLVHEAKGNFYYKKTFLLKQVFKFVPNEAYILDGCAPLITALSAKKSIQMELFLGGDHPKEIVALMEMPDDFYNPDNPRNALMVRNILKAEYQCKPLTAAPLREPQLSAMPFLCTKK